MNLNDNFAIRVSVHAGSMPWTPSPMQGVDRRMLDRIGDEVARATSIVRYAPNSSFSTHVHGGGEEFLVLDGVFQDEHGDYPAGTYVRNPPQSQHTPGSRPGCTIFVKLWQFRRDDRQHVVRDTNALEFQPLADHSAIHVMALYRDTHERVTLESWLPDSQIEFEAPSGAEVLVLEGGFSEAGEEFARHSWLRLPQGASAELSTGRIGAKVWVKRYTPKSEVFSVG